MMYGPDERCDCCGSYAHPTDACPEWSYEHPDAWQMNLDPVESDVIGNL